jgi:hypothetical protein
MQTIAGTNNMNKRAVLTGTIPDLIRICSVSPCSIRMVWPCHSVLQGWPPRIVTDQAFGVYLDGAGCGIDGYWFVGLVMLDTVVQVHL